MERKPFTISTHLTVLFINIICLYYVHDISDDSGSWREMFEFHHARFISVAFFIFTTICNFLYTREIYLLKNPHRPAFYLGIFIIVGAYYNLATGNIRGSVFMGDDRYFIGVPMLLIGVYCVFLSINKK